MFQNREQKVVGSLLSFLPYLRHLCEGPLTRSPLRGLCSGTITVLMLKGNKCEDLPVSVPPFQTSLWWLNCANSVTEGHLGPHFDVDQGQRITACGLAICLVSFFFFLIP